MSLIYQFDLVNNLLLKLGKIQLIIVITGSY